MKDGKLKKFLIKARAPFLRMGLKNRDYTIISNNCWGGVKSRNFGLPYNSPTCGLFFFSKEYLKFCSDLKLYISAELKPLSVADSQYKEELFLKFPEKKEIVLGKVLDVEVVFLHYQTFDEAKEKWNRRKARINWDNLIVKYNDQNLFSEEDFYEFEKLPYKNKIFFTANEKFINKPNTYYFSCFKEKGYVVDDIKTSEKYFKLKKYFNRIKK